MAGLTILDLLLRALADVMLAHLLAQLVRLVLSLEEVAGREVDEPEIKVRVDHDVLGLGLAGSRTLMSRWARPRECRKAMVEAI